MLFRGLKIRSNCVAWRSNEQYSILPVHIFVHLVIHSSTENRLYFPTDKRSSLSYQRVLRWVINEYSNTCIKVMMKYANEMFETVIIHFYKKRDCDFNDKKVFAQPIFCNQFKQQTFVWFWLIRWHIYRFLARVCRDIQTVGPSLLLFLLLLSWRWRCRCVFWRRSRWPNVVLRPFFWRTTSATHSLSS